MKSNNICRYCLGPLSGNHSNSSLNRDDKGFKYQSIHPVLWHGEGSPSPRAWLLPGFLFVETTVPAPILVSGGLFGLASPPAHYVTVSVLFSCFTWQISPVCTCSLLPLEPAPLEESSSSLWEAGDRQREEMMMRGPEISTLIPPWWS